MKCPYYFANFSIIATNCSRLTDNICCNSGLNWLYWFASWGIKNNARVCAGSFAYAVALLVAAAALKD